jgi:hypothetical protein
VKEAVADADVEISQEEAARLAFNRAVVLRYRDRRQPQSIAKRTELSVATARSCLFTMLEIASL